MAYAKTQSRRKATGTRRRSPRRTSAANRRPVRRGAQRNVRGGRATSRQQTVRIVIEQAPTTALARPDIGGQTEKAPRKGKF